MKIKALAATLGPAIFSAAFMVGSLSANAQHMGIECGVTDSAVSYLVDHLDDLDNGALDGPLLRSCDASSDWAEGKYAVSAAEGRLRVQRTHGGAGWKSLTTTKKGSTLRFDGFPAMANSFSMVIHGADRNGVYVENTRMHLLVKAPDGTELWSTVLRVNGPYYPLGMVGQSRIGSVELRRLSHQPNDNKAVYAVVDHFEVSEDPAYPPPTSANEQLQVVKTAGPR